MKRNSENNTMKKAHPDVKPPKQPFKGKPFGQMTARIPPIVRAEVDRLLASGYNSPDIARSLSLSPAYVSSRKSQHTKNGCTYAPRPAVLPVNAELTALVVAAYAELAELQKLEALRLAA